MMFSLYIISESIQRISNVRCRILTTSGFTAQFINTSVINNDGIETRVSVFPEFLYVIRIFIGFTGFLTVFHRERFN